MDEVEDITATSDSSGDYASNHEEVTWRRKVIATPSRAQSATKSVGSPPRAKEEHSTSITIETTTTPKIYDIEWRLDEESLRSR